MNKLKIINKFIDYTRDHGKELEIHKGFKLVKEDEYLFMYWESQPFDGIQIKNLKTNKYLYALRAPAANYLNGNPREVWQVIETIRKRKHEQQE